MGRGRGGLTTDPGPHTRLRVHTENATVTNQESAAQIFAGEVAVATGLCITCNAELPARKRGGQRRYCQSCAPVVRAKPAAVTSLPAPAAPSEGRNVAATRAALQSAGRVETVAGAAALSLAEILDAGGQSGSAAAALVRELRATMDEALQGVRTSTSLVDELRARRDAKRGA